MTDNDLEARIARMLTNIGLVGPVNEPLLAAVRQLIAGVVLVEPTKHEEPRQAT